LENYLKRNNNTKTLCTLYFSHDNNARNDEKILALRCELGWEGYGIYWAVIESLMQATNYKLKLNFINALSFSLAIDTTLFNKCLNTMFELNLLIKDNVFFWSESLLKRMKIKDAIRKTRGDSGRIGGMKSRKNQPQNKQTPSKCLASDKQMLSKCLANDKQNVSNEERKEIKKERKERKESKVKKGKEEKDIPPTKNKILEYFKKNKEEQKLSFDIDNQVRLFLNHFEKEEWKVKVNNKYQKMKCWKLAVRGWIERGKAWGHIKQEGKVEHDEAWKE